MNHITQNLNQTKKLIHTCYNETKEGIKIKGPYASDTLFINEYKKFNIIVGMYHDQVLANLKLYLSSMQLILP